VSLVGDSAPTSQRPLGFAYAELLIPPCQAAGRPGPGGKDER